MYNIICKCRSLHHFKILSKLPNEIYKDSDVQQIIYVDILHAHTSSVDQIVGIDLYGYWTTSNSGAVTVV